MNEHVIRACLAAPHYAMGMGRLIEAMGWEQSDEHNADVMIFTGGADVSPELYGEKRHPSTGAHMARDAAETHALIDWLQAGKRKVLGICRGAQFLTVMAGGKLIQDVTSHAGWDHSMYTVDGKIVGVNSYHHQMCVPPKKAELIGWGENVASLFRGIPAGLDIPEDFKEPEAFKMKFQIKDRNVDALCFQYHPEFSTMPNDGMEWTIENINQWLGE